MEKTGIGMTITSLTNSLGFALGYLAPAPEMQLFCATVSLSMLFDLFYQVNKFFGTKKIRKKGNLIISQSKENFQLNFID